MPNYISKKVLIAVASSLSFITTVNAQSTVPDSATGIKLQEVEIKAYEQNATIYETPAAVNIITTRQLERFNNTSILPALNATPGVRMEERSPGSYRLSIRGSSLRSPYGVRNVKIYYNDIPFTDPGGHSYFNQLGFYNIRSLEIIKGPGSSLYGAGTGGVMLIGSNPEEQNTGVKVGYTAGGYGLSHLNAELRVARKDAVHTRRYQRITSNGYRDHSQMRRDVVSWDTEMKLGKKDKLTANFLYSDLFYQTPGALTLAEYQNNPQADRPAAGAFPGASEARAGIYQQMFLAGFTNKHEFSERLTASTTLYGIYNQLRNPTIQNYGRNTEPHFGGRTTFTYEQPLGESVLDVVAGAEVQHGFATIRTYKNRGGNPDTLMYDDELDNSQYFGFAQVGWKYRRWVLTGGLSANRQRIKFARLNSFPYASAKQDFDNGLAPRLALLYKLKQHLSIYTNVAKGFSPPTSAELLPSGNDYNAALRAEYGWNYELGSRGSLLDNRLSYDMSMFLFRMNNTIVVRRDVGGGNYFVNAGGTDQKGMEAFLKYQLTESNGSFITSSAMWSSYSYYNFKYDVFRRLDEDFSGNQLPGVAPHTITTGLDVYTRLGLYVNATLNYVDKISLNDAGSVTADAYQLVNVRLGYKKLFRSHYLVEVFAGADNLLDENYSLGNDINGFGGRYYNAAMGRNYSAGITLGYNR
ncbi:MAG: TonB-dependent receptor [Sphingobacteriales bacterium]|nr:MAG: TonB-dependent receptor [Sphingobacteriales bacterium]